MSKGCAFCTLAYFEASLIRLRVLGVLSSMRSRENIVRLKRFQVREKSRQLAQLDTMVAEFERMAQELDLQIANEEKKAGITDIAHFAYPTFAKAARTRKENLQVSQRDLKIQREAAEAALAEADAELAKAEALEMRDGRPKEPEAVQPSSAMIG